MRCRAEPSVSGRDRDMVEVEVADTLPDPRRWQVLAVVGAAFVMTILDVAIVNVALPSIQTDLDISEGTVQWVITAYAITLGGFLLLVGGWPTLWVDGRSSSSVSCCSPSPRWCAGSRGTPRR
jgi:MFS family permease